jgi:hypothetical protein
MRLGRSLSDGKDGRLLAVLLGAEWWSYSRPNYDCMVLGTFRKEELRWGQIL